MRDNIPPRALTAALLLCAPAATAAPLTWDWSPPDGHRYAVTVRLRYPSATWLRAPDGSAARALDLEASFVLGCAAGPPDRRHTTTRCRVEQASLHIDPHEPDAEAAAAVASGLSAQWTGAVVTFSAGDDGLIRRFEADDIEETGAALLRLGASCLEVVVPEEAGAQTWLQKQSVTGRPLRLTHERSSSSTDERIDAVVYPTRAGRSVQYVRRYSFSDAGHLLTSQQLYSQVYPDIQPGFTPTYREHVRCERIAPGEDLVLESPGVRDVTVPEVLR